MAMLPPHEGKKPQAYYGPISNWFIYAWTKGQKGMIATDEQNC